MKGASVARTKIATFFVASAALVAALVGGSSAQAEELSTCTTPVVDTTSDLVLDVPAIEAAVEAANIAGADFYVRAFETAPDGSLDAYWQNSIVDCANWRNGTPDSVNPKGNIVAVFFSMDRESAIFYGPGFNQAIGDAKATAIRADMNEFFREGNFTGGVENALQELSALTDPESVSPVTADEPGEPVDLTWLGLVMFWFIMVVTGLVVLITVVLFVRGIRNLVVRRAGAKARAVSARAQAAKLITAWEKDKDFVSIEFLVNGGMLAAATLKWYQDALESILSTVDAASRDFSSGPSVDVSAKKPLKVHEYESAAEYYQNIVDTLSSATITLNGLKKRVVDDMHAFSFGGQAEQADELSELLDTISSTLDGYGRLFNTSSTLRTTREIQEKLLAVQFAVTQQVDIAKSYKNLKDLRDEVGQLSEVVSEMQPAAKSLADPRSTLEVVIKKARSNLDNFNVETSDEESQIQRLEDGIDEVLRKIDPTRSLSRQLEVLDGFQRRVASIVSQAQVRDANYRKEQQKKRDKERRRADADRRSRSSYGTSSSSDAVTGAVIGAYIGSSYGSSSSSSSSSSGSDFGGGSSGSFGGGDSGGGSSGSW